MLGEDARIEEEDREFNHSDSRSIEIFEDVKDIVPLLRRVRTSHCLVLAKVEVGRCPSNHQPFRTRLSQELRLDQPIRFRIGNIQASGIATIMA